MQGISLRELSRRTNVPQRTLSDWFQRGWLKDYFVGFSGRSALHSEDAADFILHWRKSKSSKEETMANLFDNTVEDENLRTADDNIPNGEIVANNDKLDSAQAVTIDVETLSRAAEFNHTWNITAEGLRKWLPANYEARQPCFACGRHSSITHCHHVVPLKSCAYLLRKGFTSRIEDPLVWLCPNCHAYLHQLLNGNAGNVKEDLEPEIVHRLLVLVKTGDEIISAIVGNEYYTPADIIEAARRVLGEIDLDPASCEVANQTVKAKTYYDATTDGLKQEWRGRVWLNPPFAKGMIEKFIDKLVGSLSNIESAVVFVDNCTETKWFGRLVDNCNAIVFPQRRIICKPYGEENLSSPTCGQVLVYFGTDAEKFFAEFCEIGTCWLPWRNKE